MIYYFPLHSIIALAAAWAGQAAPEVAPLSNFIMNLFPAQLQLEGRAQDEQWSDWVITCCPPPNST